MAVIVGGKSGQASTIDPNASGPPLLDWLKTRMDLSMVKDSPVASRYAVSSVDGGNVPIGIGSSSGGGGGGAGVISFNGRTGVVLSAKSDYSVEILTDVTITSPTNDEVLTYESGVWVNKIVPSGFSNPMTTDGDMIYGETGGTAERLGIGTTGEVLTVSAGLPSWAAPTGFSDPMTTKGDIIYEDATPAPNRLAIGMTNYGILSIAGLPQWAVVYSPLNPQPFNWGFGYMVSKHAVTR